MDKESLRNLLEKICQITEENNREMANSILEMRVPPANHLEALQGDRTGQYSIRINDQYRTCFRVEADNFYDVEIIDYH